MIVKIRPVEQSSNTVLLRLVIHDVVHCTFSIGVFLYCRETSMHAQFTGDLIVLVYLSAIAYCPKLYNYL